MEFLEVLQGVVIGSVVVLRSRLQAIYDRVFKRKV